MKKKFCFVILLLSAMGFASCGSDDEPETPVQTDPTDNTEAYEKYGFVEGAIINVSGDTDKHEDVYQFFKSELPQTSFGKEISFLFSDEDASSCHFVNSLSDLQAVYHGDAQLPKIDFDKYTLIIGKQRVASYGARQNRQAFYEKDGQRVLDIFFYNDIIFPAIADIYFWGLYPKFEDRAVKINIIYRRM